MKRLISLILVSTMIVLTGCFALQEAEESTGLVSAPTVVVDVEATEPTETATAVPEPTDAPEIGTADEAPTETTASEDSLIFVDGYIGRFKLVDNMDDPLGYCLDVPGPATNIILRLPPWTHSCHPSDEPDQIFRYNLDGAGQMHFLFEEFDFCLTANAAEAGSGFSFEACGEAANQGFDVTASGLIMLRDSNLCLVVRNMAQGDSQSEIGAGRVIAPGDLMRTLELDVCGTVIPAFETWEAIDE